MHETRAEDHTHLFNATIPISRCVLLLSLDFMVQEAPRHAGIDELASDYKLNLSVLSPNNSLRQ